MDGRYKVFLRDGTLLREFNDKDIAAHFSEQVWNIGHRHNKLVDSVTGETVADFTI